MAGNPADERTCLFVLLAALTLAASLLLLVFHSHLLVAPWVLVSIAIPWIAFSLFLRTHRATWGREREYVDLWSITHLIGGALFGMLDIGLLWVLVLTVWWELAESFSRMFEHLTNRVTDVVIGVVGWAAAQLVLTGALRLA